MSGVGRRRAGDRGRELRIRLGNGYVGLAEIRGWRCGASKQTVGKQFCISVVRLRNLEAERPAKLRGIDVHMVIGCDRIRIRRINLQVDNDFDRDSD